MKIFEERRLLWKFRPSTVCVMKEKNIEIYVLRQLLSNLVYVVWLLATNSVFSDKQKPQWLFRYFQDFMFNSIKVDSLSHPQNIWKELLWEVTNPKLLVCQNVQTINLPGDKCVTYLRGKHYSLRISDASEKYMFNLSFSDHLTVKFGIFSIVTNRFST